MNSENSKASEPHRLLTDLSDIQDYFEYII